MMKKSELQASFLQWLKMFQMQSYLAEEEIEKSYKCPQQYQKDIPQSINTDVSKRARYFTTAFCLYSISNF